MRNEQSPFGTTKRRWAGVSWWFSLFFLVPLLGLIGTFLYLQFGGSNGVAGVILDAYTEKPIAGASIAASATEVVSASDGSFRLEIEPSQLTVQKPGYDPTQIAVTPGVSDLSIRLRPNVVQGKVTNRVSGQPLSGVMVEAKVDGTVVGSATSGPDGTYLLADVPSGASLVFTSPDYAAETVGLERKTEVDATLRPDVVTGTVVDQDGKPVEGASVVIGEAKATTAADGAFRLQGAPSEGQVIVKRPGYRASVSTLDPSLHVSVKLSRIDVKALYATAGTAGEPDRLNTLIDAIDKTEANALVVDVKDSSGMVFINTQVSLAHEIGAVEPAYDPAEMVKKLHDKNIYAIARIVVFEDPVLAEAKPDWAIHDSANGDLWRTWNGLAWVNAHRQEVWDYNIALAKEVALDGFDEIQLDYIRFPSDGPLNRAEYGVPHDDKTRPEAITAFLTKAHDALAQTPAYLTGDVFGLTLWELGDGGIGQHLESFAPVLDYIHPMIYPSHFYPGSMGFDIPNDHPHDVILWSLENGLKRIPDFKDKLRPWLQDFSYGEGIEYGDAEVAAQIQACQEFGTTGWLLWNAGNVYHTAALKPE